MYYSYYFDTKKTHVVNLGFNSETFTVQADGTIITKVTAYIQEVMNETRIKHEQQTLEFTFPAAQRVEDPQDYDIDLLRERYAPDMKWVFIIKNNRNPLQKIQIGLISESANKNPLGMDIFYQDEKYKSELKASNLARLEVNYIPPSVKQTVTNIDFSSPGFPDGLTAIGATYDSNYKLYEAKEFAYILKEPIKANTKFKLSMNLAPSTVEVKNPPKIFTFNMHGIGVFYLNQNSISYLAEGQDANNTVIKDFPSNALPLSPQFFFNYGLTDKSLLEIEGDGAGGIKIRYGGISLQSTYNASKRFVGFSYEGASMKVAQ